VDLLADALLQSRIYSGGTAPSDYTMQYLGTQEINNKTRVYIYRRPGSRIIQEQIIIISNSWQLTPQE
jgi:hypothetical protein